MVFQSDPPFLTKPIRENGSIGDYDFLFYLITWMREKMVPSMTAEINSTKLFHRILTV